MRVLHIGKYYPPFAGGIEHFLADLLPELHRRGIVSAALVHNEQRSWRGRYPNPSDPLAIYRAPCYGRVLYAPVSPAFPLWLAQAIREMRPDLLHLHMPNTSAFWAMFIPAARRLPWVVHWHADVVASTIDRRLALAYHLYRPWEQRLLAASNAIIATSTPYLNASTALARWRARCHVIPLGLAPHRLPEPDSAALARAAALWGDKTGFRILAIGRLTYYKGHEVLIRAVANLSDSRTLLAGTGDRRDRLAALIHSLQLDERVTLTGFQPQADLYALLASCDVLCLPSLERTEAFGMVLLEAMRFGKPVVVSDIPGSGPGWVVREGGHGLLVPPGDSSALAAALQTLQQDHHQRRRLGQTGTTALQTRFGIDRVALAVADLYATVLAKT